MGGNKKSKKKNQKSNLQTEKANQLNKIDFNDKSGINGINYATHKMLKKQIESIKEQIIETAKKNGASAEI